MDTMKLYKLLIKISLILGLTALPIIWLIGTSSGLNTVLSIACLFASPLRLSYEQASGQIIGKPIEIEGITIQYEQQALHIGKLTVNWPLRILSAHNIRGADKFLPNADFLHYQEILLDSLYVHLKSVADQNVISIHFNGQASHTPLDGAVRITKSKDLWNIVYTQLKIGKNSAYMYQDQNGHYKWNLNILEAQAVIKNSSGSITANGIVHSLQTLPHIQANINSKALELNSYKVINLHSTINLMPAQTVPLVFAISADSISSATNKVQDIKVNLTGNATFDPKTHKGKITLHGPVLTVPTSAIIQINNKNDIELKLGIHTNQYNKLTAAMHLQNNKLNGTVNIAAEDLAFLMQWMPEVTRLKAKLNAVIQITGDVNAPDIISQAHITDITATIPSLGIKIKPMALHITSNKYGKFILTGNGKMRRGPGEFQLQGYIEPFKDNMPNNLTITGKNIEFINNNMARLIASNNLNIHYVAEKQQVDVTGSIEVHEGNITIADKNTQTVKSKDVVFVNEDAKPTKELIAFNPNIYLRIEEGVQFTGFNLEGTVSGKLNISKKHDALYADGRITIKKGYFQLPGQKLEINHGRILYPPGTLLVNPVLDIRMINNDLELVVQGSAQKPMLSENSLTGNKDKLITQALITSSSIISNNIIQDKLKISEIGLTPSDGHQIDFFDDPSRSKGAFKHKDLVIGRPLGKRFYVQYLHSIGDANKKVRLKYSLSPIWAIGIESGATEEGFGGGADLSFTVERD